MWQLCRLLGFGAVLAVALTASTESVFAQKKDKKGGARDESFAATPVDYAKIKNVKELSGTILAIDPISKTMTLRVDTPRMEPNPNYKAPKGTNPNAKGGGGANTNYQQQYAQINATMRDLQKQQQAAMLARNPQEKQRALQRIQIDMVKLQQQQAQLMAKMNGVAVKNGKGNVAKDGKGNPGNVNPNNQPFRTVSSYKDYELNLKDEVTVRKMFLPLEYDDTGNIKKYSDKEKEELRGKDPTKPGYAAKADEIQPSQEVRVLLTAPKAVKKAPDAPKDDGVGNVDRPTVTMILMTKELPGGGIPAAPEKKKKKK